MAADDETQDSVRRTLRKRPPEKLPAGAEDRLRKRLDEEQSATKRTAHAKLKTPKPKKRAR
jgi:hypothetical protein